ncbi:hypothetical protein [uncultured Bacteroides sp.]|uniref:hypothetical protein n=1 Tax=uncultured Bacteroides sp. TaxID=162156 RepID=UPI0025E8BF90|nr:hypothetical protein [uncultured Bacteroides sp.]
MDKQIEMELSDAIIEKPVWFGVGKRRYGIYPPTLGKAQILKNLYLGLDLDARLLAINPLAEAMRISRASPDIVCRIIAYSTFGDKGSIMNTEKVFQRADMFKDRLTTEEMATLLSVILMNDKTEEFIRYFSIDREKELRERLGRVKGESNGITFGGKSIYGLLIDFACQRYGWTMDYVLWGISYVNLNMLFADAITTVYLTDDERKQLGMGFGPVINADDPANRDLIREMISG